MSRTGDLTPRQAWDLLASDPAARLVDVRTRAEWSFVGVPDLSDLGREAALVEWSTFPGGDLNGAFLDQARAQVGDAADTAPVVFLCRSGVRSVGAADAAADAGWARTYNVLGGFEGPVGPDGHRGGEGWRADGLPWRQS